MICLNSAGNLVRSEVGSKKWRKLSPLIGRGGGSRTLGQVREGTLIREPKPRPHAQDRPITAAQREERKLFPKGVWSRAQPFCVKGEAKPVCTWNHRAINTTLTVQGADQSRSRWLDFADPQTGVAKRLPLAAICVQSVDVQCVLQFTLIHAAGCVLHRRTSRVIHRLKLYFHSFDRIPTSKAGRQFRATHQVPRQAGRATQSGRPTFGLCASKNKRKKGCAATQTSIKGEEPRGHPHWGQPVARKRKKTLTGGARATAHLGLRQIL